VGATVSAADLNLSVLVVTRNVDELAGVRAQLQRRGHHVCSVGTAAAALARADECRFDVVVCDTILPDGDGLRFGAELSRNKSLPAIALSDASDGAAVYESLAAGMMAHVAKPAHTDSLPVMVELVARYPRARGEQYGSAPAIHPGCN
jgi:CheY-like chemotaxis protein